MLYQPSQIEEAMDQRSPHLNQQNKIDNNNNNNFNIFATSNGSRKFGYHPYYQPDPPLGADIQHNFNASISTIRPSEMNVNNSTLLDSNMITNGLTSQLDRVKMDVDGKYSDSRAPNSSFDDFSPDISLDSLSRIPYSNPTSMTTTFASAPNRNGYQRQLPDMEAIINHNSPSLSHFDENSVYHRSAMHHASNYNEHHHLPSLLRGERNLATEQVSGLPPNSPTRQVTNVNPQIRPNQVSNGPIRVTPSTDARVRQLPIVTPYGPKPIKKPFAQLQIMTNETQRSPVGNTRSANLINQHPVQNYPIDTRNSEQPESFNSPIVTDFPVQIAPRPIHAPVHQLRSDLPLRQLPIITKQGVLKLRDKSSSASAGINRTGFPGSHNDLIVTRTRTARNSDGSEESTTRYDRNLQHEDTFSDEAEVQTMSDHSRDELDTNRHDEILSDDNIRVSDENVDAEESDSASMTEREQLESDTPSLSQEEQFVSMNYEDTYAISENIDYPLGQTNEEECEAEYYSALATVPEEEGKLSDRDDTNTEMMLDEIDQSVDVTSTANGPYGHKKLPTIAENGFEAQVIEYLAERSGLKRGELFSVDEEPSSYNDEIDTRGSDEFTSETKPEVGSSISHVEVNSFDNPYQTRGGEAIQHQDSLEMTSFPETSNIQGNIHNNTLSNQTSECYNDNITQELRDSFNNHEIINEEENETHQKEGIEFDHEEQADADHQDYYFGEKIGDYDYEDDEKIVLSPDKNKTSFEQDEYDEQYRDINNQDDIDRRATNHVHAIDGHSKSMLNDIHQQQTINDYYDGGEEYVDGNQVCEQSKYSAAGQAFQNDAGGDVIFQPELREENRESLIEPRGVMEGSDENRLSTEETRKDDLTNGFSSDLPRAKIRWITAVDKIVNRNGEVSKFLFAFFL